MAFVKRSCWEQLERETARLVCTQMLRDHPEDRELVRLCQSPLERVLFAALRSCAFIYRCKSAAPIDVTPQCKIPPYSADFVLSGGSRPVVVEVDGHDFHERTKEQAAHDKSRDRSMQLAGYVVLRFTGSEVNADPIRCACEAVVAATGVQLR